MLTERFAPETGTSALSGARPSKSGRSPTTKLFLAFIGLVAVAYFALIAYRTSVPSAPSETGDIAADARAYLAAAHTAQSLPQAATESPSVMGQSHPLVGKRAPDFELTDTEGQKVSLRDLRREGPVIVVFYYGYYCSHCVAQLFALEDDLPKFTRHGVHIVALSADPSSQTAARFRQYGRFHFPVLSDRDNQVAEQYAVYTRGSANHDEDLKHGTFLVDQNGQIAWAFTGDRPFVDNAFLLNLVARKPEQSTTGQRNASVPTQSKSKSASAQ
jgi:thioredoxin-dependent peroxiredoxin